MRFLFVGPGFPNVPGVASGSGIGTYLFELTKGLVEHGHTCDVLVWSVDPSPHVITMGRVTIHAIPRRRYRLVERWWPELRMERDLARAAIRLDRLARYDWVELQADEGLEHRVQAYFGQRAILRVHTTLEHMVRFKQVARTRQVMHSLQRERDSLCRASRIFASSDLHIRELKTDYPCAVSPNLVPLGFNAVDAIRKIDRGTPVILAVASSDRRKGLDRLGQALVCLRTMIDRFRCVLVCSDQERAERCLTEGLRGELPAVEYRSGLSPQELVAEYCRASVFVHLARYESFGYPLVEAAAYGTPIVSTAVGVAPALLAGVLRRYLVDGDDAQSIANAMAAAVWDDEASVLLRRRYLDGYTRHQMVTTFLETLGAGIGIDYQRTAPALHPSAQCVA